MFHAQGFIAARKSEFHLAPTPSPIKIPRLQTWSQVQKANFGYLVFIEAQHFRRGEDKSACRLYFIGDLEVGTTAAHRTILYFSLKMSADVVHFAHFPSFLSPVSRRSRFGVV